MPQPKSVLPLQLLCVRYVADNIDDLCTEHTALQTVDQRLFNAIPFCLRGAAACLNHLLNHKLFLVRIPHWASIHFDMTRLLSKVGELGDELVELHVLALLCDVFTPDVVSALSRLPRLQRLTLKLMGIGETVVAAVTQHCTQLTEVALYGSCLTDDCLDLFAVCQNIEVLIVNCYIMNPDATAARSLKVLSLPHLRIFRCDILTQVIRLLDVSTRLRLTEYGEMNQVNLRTNNVLAHVFHVCPMLTTVSLHLLGDEDVEAMQCLTSLRDLSLYFWPIGSGIAFMIEFQQVLRVIGGGLKILRLWLANLEFTSITTHCTALEELEICHLNWIRNYSSHQLARLTRLESFRLSLRVLPFVMPSIPGQIIGALNSKLKRLDLETCHLSDGLLEALLDYGKLEYLETLRLSRVCCLTVRSLRKLMARRSPFKLLHVSMCPKITNADIVELRWIVRVLNLDVVVLDDYITFTIS